MTPLPARTLPASPRPSWPGWTVLLLVLASSSVDAGEIEFPATQYFAATAPRLAQDPDRPADAPTADAIEAVTAEDGAEAGLRVATKALDSSRIAYGIKDGRTVVALSNQATARQRAGQTAAALQDYRAAIELAEASGGPRDARLVEAWYGLGYTQLLAGQVDAAAAALGTALQLHRVNRGLYSAEQLDLLQALASALRATGHDDDATELQMRRLTVAERVFGVGTVEVARAYIPVGRWFREQGLGDEALSLHALSVSILEKQDEGAAQLIEPLLELALSGGTRRRQENGLILPGNLQPPSVLARAEKIAESRHSANPVELAKALTRIGDANLSLARREQANRLYARAARLFSEAQQPQAFSEPAFVIFRPPASAPVEGGGYLLAEFTVETSGRVKNPRIVESQPATLDNELGARLRQALSEARLRPRIENGTPVTTNGVRYRYTVRGGSA